MLLHTLLAWISVALVHGQASATGPAKPSDRSQPRAAVPHPSIETPQAMATWLMNLARHQGHLVGRSDPRSVSLHVMSLLEAAVEVDSHCADAYYWLYDLQHRLGQTERASLSLARYVQLAPHDDAARICLFEIGLDEQQTAENRVHFVQSALQTTPLTPVYEGELHYWLARFYFERRDTEQAGKEIENALRLNAMNIHARELAYEMFGETQAELQRVEMALQLISINPTQARLVWELGEFLDHLSLHKQAQEWFNRAVAIHKAFDPNPVPAEFHQALAMSYLSSEDYARAREAATAALAANPNLQAAKLLRSTALAKLGKTQESTADIDAVAKTYDDRLDEIISKKPADEAADAAWFYCYHKPDKEKALKLAEVAKGAANPGDLAKLSYGYALRMNGRTDEAEKTLKPLAETDQLAALEMAKIHMERSRKAEAITLLNKAAGLQHSGIAYRLLQELLNKYGEKAPRPPAQTKIIAALDKFQRDVFDFPKRPTDFLRFTLQPAAPQPSILGPIDVVFRVENTGPFAITFGEGFMVRPLVALSATLGGTEPATFKDYLQVLMNARPMLLPGDAMEKTVAIDVGPIREHLTRLCASTLKLELTAMLDPVYRNNELIPGQGTIVAETLSFEPKILDASSAAVGDLVTKAGEGDVPARIKAAQQVGALLCAAEKGKTKASVSRLPISDLRNALAGLLGDKDWRVRAHAVTAASWSTMDGPITNAAAAGVKDDNPLVKVLTVRLFASQHGEKFKPVLEQLSKTDPSRFVRLMAISYLPDASSPQAGAGMNTSDASP